MRPLTRGERLSIIAGLAFVGVLLGGYFLVREARFARRAEGGSELRALGEAMNRWSDDHQEWLTSGSHTLDELVTAGYLTADDLHSPSDPRSGRVSYVVMPPPTGNASRPRQSRSSQSMFAYEIACDPHGTNVMFIDGHVDWMRTDEFLAEYRRYFEEYALPYVPPVACE